MPCPFNERAIPRRLYHGKSWRSLFSSGGIPRSYVVGRDGQILFQSMGYTAAEFEELKKVIDRELSKTQNAQGNK